MNSSWKEVFNCHKQFTSDKREYNSLGINGRKRRFWFSLGIWKTSLTYLFSNSLCWNTWWNLPEKCQIILDPLETLTFLSANTTKILLDISSVIDMLFHNPVVLDIRFASLVIFSQGRCIAGFGIGWSKDEFKFPMCHLIIREIGHTNM